MENDKQTYARQVIAYWRKSLADADLLSLDANSTEKRGTLIRDIYDGKLNEGLADALFEEVYEQRNEPSPKQRRAEQSKSTTSALEEDEEEYIDVLLAPYVLSVRYVHAYRNRRDDPPFYPLIVPARMRESGQLYPHPDLVPWIPRAYLQPSPQSDITLGEIDVFDTFLTTERDQLKPHNDLTWDHVTAWGERLLNVVAGDRWKEMLVEIGCEFRKHSHVVGLLGSSKFNINVQNVYDHLLRQAELPTLLTEYVAPTHVEPKPLFPVRDWKPFAQRHLGSVSAEFGLSSTQREALYHYLSLPTATVLPVNGPPGTGKTTLIQSVVASLWVEAALEQASPPLIVASSTNNQAVTNVIESFARLSNVKRWLDVPSFGLYLVNSEKKQRQAESKGIAWRNKYGDKGFHQTAETERFVSEQMVLFLQRCREKYGAHVVNLPQAIQQLHSDLTETAQRLQAGIEAAYTWAKAADTYAQESTEIGTFAERKETITVKIREQEDEQTRLQQVERDWLKHQNEMPWWMSVFAFLPAVAKRRTIRNRLFALEQLPSFDSEATDKLVSQHLVACQTEAKEAIQTDNAKLADVTAQETRYGALEADWTSWRETEKMPALMLDGLLSAENETASHPFFEWLDVTVRHKLFQIATHYWEARWLQEVRQKKITNPNRKTPHDRESTLARWRRYAMLTPCFVTTMQSGPGFFNYLYTEFVPLFGGIDLLIIDEAGQVLPDLSGAMMALSKQALIVGDTQQIEPIWKLPAVIDVANLEKQQLIKEEADFESFPVAALRASRGSVMQLAQYCSPFQIEPRGAIAYEPGMFLADHRRCVPEIIAYCNELAYGGALVPRRPALDDYPWPHMGYLHVKGTSERMGSSRYNVYEARAIVAWVAKNRPNLEAHYGQDLTDIVAIITPFAAQKRTLQKQLKEYEIQIDTVGTVHALQGGERAVVIFSSVYSGRDAGTYFFDINVNMLNVAVSRAKDCFLTIGDMDIFDARYDKPSGLLARYLFTDEANEIIDVPLPERHLDRDDEGGGEIRHITDLEGHRRTLSRAFEKAQQRIVIVSPYLRIRAVEEDEICSHVEAAVARGAEVLIYVDLRFNENLNHQSAQAAAEKLREAGARVIVCRNIHSKILCVDNSVFVEGSFNWLSAERINRHHQLYETSMIYTGKDCARFIKETIRHLEVRTL